MTHGPKTTRRARAARRIAPMFARYAAQKNPSNYEDDQTTLVDWLADVMHWATDAGVDFDGALESAQGHFLAEEGDDTDDEDDDEDDEDDEDDDTDEDDEDGDEDEDEDEEELDLPPGVTLTAPDLDNLPALARGVRVVLQIENRYTLYADVTTYADVVVPAPPPNDDQPDPTGEHHTAYAAWAYTHIYSLTGAGHCRGASFYDVTVLWSSDPDLVGETFDWGY